MTHLVVSPFLVFLAACTPVVAGTIAKPLQDAPPEPENGFLGFQPPEVTDVRVTDTLLHQDTHGGVVQELLGIAGSRGGGFGLVWRDQRDASLGIYWVRLEADGTAREPERPVTSSKGTSRRFDPAIALSPDGAGALAWVTRGEGGQRPWMRCFDAQGAFHGDDLLVAAPPGPAEGRGAGAAPRGGARDGAAAGAGTRSPVLLARRDGSRTLIWLEGGRVRLGDFDVAGSALRPSVELGRAGTEPEVGLHALEDAAGGVGVLWTGKSGAWFAHRPPTPAKVVDLEVGAGRARGLALDENGGFVALLERGESAVVRRIGSDGKWVGPEVVHPLAGLRNAALEPVVGGFALLATLSDSPASPGRDGRGGGRAQPAETTPQRGGAAEPKTASSARLELLLLDEKLEVREAALAITTPAARAVDDAFLASNGSRLLVAWTDTRQGDGDVFGRIVDTSKTGAERLGLEKRLNSDEASADQVAPDIDAIGTRGISAWQDRRDGPSAIYARRFDATGPTGGEVLLPIVEKGARPKGGATDAAVALRPDGSALVVWLQREGDVGRLVGQILAADGAARSGLIEVEARVPGIPAVSRLSGDRGWVVVWAGPEKSGIQARRIAPDGSMPGPARRLDDGRDVTTDGDVTLLDDGRLVAGWTMHKSGSTQAEGWSLSARFLDADGGPKGGEFAFEPSRRNQDHDPVFAPAANGGFLMAWTSGGLMDPTRDVNVRLFDGQGRPAGPNLTPCFLANEQDFADVTRLADGSFAIAWEDDVSYYDQGYVRRIAANGLSMGAWMRIGKLDTLFVPDRVAPRITALGDGWASVFSDRQRSRGFDTRIKIVGPRFDTVSGD